MFSRVRAAIMFFVVGLAVGVLLAEGWMVIPVTEAELGQPITLVYQPIIANAGNGEQNPEVVSEIVIYAP